MVEAIGPAQERSTDEELVRLLIAGDRGAFREFYQCYHLRMYAMAYAMTGRQGAAEDLTQEIFLRVYQKLGSYRGESSFSTWFYRLAVNCCLNYRRRKQPEAEVSLADEHKIIEPLGGLERMEARVLQQEIGDQIDRAILSLKPDLRLTFIFKEIEGLSYSEIADRMGCPEGTVAWRLNKARELLARKLEHLKASL
ncbi:MAG: sigma-70 family RNA polymerase sigma factor [Blastocatellia bacterium]|nr:sigma-70 family RNA polymerase sigma factor [Blastocatellia bacterium]